ncbi:p26 [Lambdina fiscellaria nucleopolyhedrovirus]|uniref:p26 n=1 Tax=Lambdina fiscellaria nucleopolyhedrovirus TaxID=1642929 RepID=A0A0E3URD3_9ABAC|nr:p26 [Lambdina fiscellaria nucleopolyhedrovirus]AKC91740.1 p26 [Lambdina fiscellaria nucleopolyhedrovirus]
MVIGHVHAFATADALIVNGVFVGAPVFRGNELISVVTQVFLNPRDKTQTIFVIANERSPRFVAGRYDYDDDGAITVQQLRANMSVYGRRQFPFQNNSPDSSTQLFGAQQYNAAANSNKNYYRNKPRSVYVFHNAHTVHVTLVEGEFEINNLTFDGPLLDKNH